jgi:replication factor A2
VTIKQIATCDNVDDTFRIDGAELHMVKVVGTVLSLTEHATNFTYQVADSTGIIECKLWIDKETGAAARFEPNTLVKICGNLREYEGRKHVLVYDIKAVEDWNELTHHFLGETTSAYMLAYINEYLSVPFILFTTEAIYVHLQHSKGPLQVNRCMN